MSARFDELAEDTFLNPSDVAKIFGVKPYTIRIWIRDGKLEAEKMRSGRLKIRKSSVVKYAQEQFGDKDASDT